VKLLIADAALEGDFGRDVGAALGVLFQLAGDGLRLRARRGPGGLLPIREKAPHEPQDPEQGEQRQDASEQVQQHTHRAMVPLGCRTINRRNPGARRIINMY